MRLLSSLLFFVLLFTSAILAEDTKTCPADGQTAFEGFHEVVAPAWHTAWPDKDYDALIAAGPKFEKAFEGVAALNPAFASETRRNHFNECRLELGDLVKKYAGAAAAGDKNQVYELLPALHEAFERTAAATMKVKYPEFDALSVTIGLILNKHLPENNLEGITGSTETLVTRLNALDEKSLPDALTWDKDNVLKQIVGLKSIAEQMQKCCRANDMAAYKTHAGQLDQGLKAFAETYL